VIDACAAAGVEPGSDPRGAVADGVARAEAEVRRIEGAMEEAAELRASSAGDLAAASIAAALANHLKADRFERWLLAEALAQLVAGATSLLHELSGNAYSLAVDDKGAFVVVDHVNAEQVRSARTLSGGETFLASLALALALADQVATLAAGGAARLETMLLDEGFGTLDPDALEIVAAALEELGARGRTVGIVTHVQELAERMPVRFEVRKVAGSATVERMSA
jgi:exonuclease SbcC